MSYASALDRLHALGQELHTAPGAPRRKFELAHMRTLMAALGNAERSFTSILVAGTNGKGSTASTLASILTRAGYRTGLYTSPHLSRVNERIQLDGAMIADDDFAALFSHVEEVAESLVRDERLPALPSFFETLTAMGFLYFASRQVHTAVVEVGMGGRLDATNIVEPAVSVITDISLDHTEWLGSTVDLIAREKAGILRPEGVMITLPQHPEANQALGEVAIALGVRGVNAAGYVPVHNHPEQYTRNRYPLSVMGELIGIDSPLAGAHQQRNLALAIATAVELRNSHGYNITPIDIQAGIRDTVWPARLELIPGNRDRADVLLDVGHNPAGAWALRAAVSHLDRGQPLTLVFGCLKDKPAVELAQILFPLFGKVMLTPVDSPRSASVEDLLAAAATTGSEVEAAAEAIRRVGAGAAVNPGERSRRGDRVGVPSRAVATSVGDRTGCACGVDESMSSAGMSSLPGGPLPLTTRLTSNLARGPLFFFFTGAFGCMSLAASCLEKDGRLQHTIARQWARTSLRIAGAPVTVIGRENLLPVAVYTSNHTSFMDTPLVFSSLPFQFRILAKQSLWKWPFIGWHLHRSGQIPVDEEGSGSVTGLESRHPRRLSPECLCSSFLRVGVPRMGRFSRSCAGRPTSRFAAGFRWCRWR